jgi:hypothetical protein
MPTVAAPGGTLNKLLQGELAAVETYRQALAKMSHDPHALDLRRIEEEHMEAAFVLRQHIQQCGAQLPNESGVWGAWARAVEGTSILFGKAAALQALQKGEEHGIHRYEKALQDTSLAPACQTLICADLLPRARQHLSILNRLLSEP